MFGASRRILRAEEGGSPQAGCDSDSGLSRGVSDDNRCLRTLPDFLKDL